MLFRSSEIMQQGAQDYLVKGQTDGELLCRTLHHAVNRHRMDSELRENRRSYELLFESICDGLAHHRVCRDNEGNPCDYVFLEVNPAYEQITGLSRDEVIGRSARDLFPEISDEQIRVYTHVAVVGGKYSFYDKQVAPGRVFEVIAYQTQPDHFTCIYLDVTEQQRAEDEQRLLQERIQQLQRLDGVGRLAGKFAHDFNNMLAGIMGGVDLLELRLGDDDEQVCNSLQRIGESGVQLADLFILARLAFLDRQ